MYNITKNIEIIEFPQRKEDLTSIGIFISSLILSIGGCITMILAQIQKSKCQQIKCLGLKCLREVEV